MPQEPDGSSVSAASGADRWLKTQGPGDRGPLALQVTVTPEITVRSEPPEASGLSPAATVPLSGPTPAGAPLFMAGFLVPPNTTVPPPARAMVRVEVIRLSRRRG
ncbi:hypothetical protein [Streptomyces sp. NPDC096012]|uniref:hypothetical protein n=1 Tax=Streptomyces sp. NPDC096012 TaxID=3155684 RepID=UPI00336AC615